MKNYYDYKTTIEKFQLQLSNTLSIEEREIHPYHEILYCSDVQTVLHTESRQLKLMGNNLIIIPKGQYHLFDLTNIDQFARLKIVIPEETISSLPCRALFSNIQVHKAINFHTELLIRQICEVLHEEQKHKQGFYLTSSVMMLLAELTETPPIKLEHYYENSSVLIQITKHISQNLSDDLSIPNLAKAMNVSPSFLTHRFQKELGISIHRYITQKRMIYARELIDSGYKPTKIYLKCGYKDYSTFYKAYCNFFHIPPSGLSEKQS